MSKTNEESITQRENQRIKSYSSRRLRLGSRDAEIRNQNDVENIREEDGKESSGSEEEKVEDKLPYCLSVKKESTLTSGSIRLLTLLPGKAVFSIPVLYRK